MFLKFFHRVQLWRKSYKIPLLYLPLFACLKIISSVLLKHKHRILSFNLTPPLPFFKGYPLSAYGKNLTSQTALVLQGPICKISPQISINFAAQAKETLGVGHVIYAGPDYKAMESTCDYAVPSQAFTGSANIFKLQRASTLAGLELAQKCGAKHTLKLRADALILRRDAILTLMERLHSDQKCKLVVTSQQKPYYPLYMSDHLQFGLTDDVHKLWNLDWQGTLRQSFKFGQKCDEQSAPFAEFVLGQNFYKNSPNHTFLTCTANDIGYAFLKYNYYDANRFDWESSPHFGVEKLYPSEESCLTSVEERNTTAFGGNVYDKVFQK